MPLVRVGENELFYVEHGEGHPVVLVHGLAGDHSAWTPQLPRLADRYRVVAFDNRGAGQSTQRDEPVSTEDLAGDTLALMDALGIERAHIVGRSMGGAVAQHVALRTPERVASLVLLASFARLDPLGRRVLTNMREVLEWTGSWAAHARHSIQNFVSARFYNEQPDAVERIESLIGGETRLQACYVRQNHACLEHDTLPRLAEIAAPTLIMGGGRDPICSPTTTSWLGAIPGSETLLFEDSSHFFLLEEQERFMTALEGWLARQTSA
jgi:pimeloyl-ACP methyl ester carboxylesterase